jgi:hypothetical protein
MILHKKKYNYDELENFWKNYKKEEEVTEKWSEKYKKSINCSDPKGFSQKAHCQGRKKNLKEESKEEDKLKRSGYDIEKIKQALQMLSQISESVGEFVPLKFKLYGYYLRRFGSPVLILFIDVDTEDGVYNTSSKNWHQIGMQLLDIFQMLGIRDERYMRPMYDFKFNKRSLDRDHNCLIIQNKVIIFVSNINNYKLIKKHGYKIRKQGTLHLQSWLFRCLC